MFECAYAIVRGLNSLILRLDNRLQIGRNIFGESLSVGLDGYIFAAFRFVDDALSFLPEIADFRFIQPRCIAPAALPAVSGVSPSFATRACSSLAYCDRCWANSRKRSVVIEEFCNASAASRKPFFAVFAGFNEVVNDVDEFACAECHVGSSIYWRVCEPILFRVITVPCRYNTENRDGEPRNREPAGRNRRSDGDRC